MPQIMLQSLNFISQNRPLSRKLRLVLSSDPSNDLFESSIWFTYNLYTNILNALRI